MVSSFNLGIPREKLRVDVKRYARLAELARRSMEDLRFQVADIGDRLWEEVFAQHGRPQRSTPRRNAILWHWFLKLPGNWLRCH